MTSPRTPSAIRRAARRSSAAALVAALVAVSAAAPAEAHYNGTGQLYAQIEVRPYNYNDTWQVPLNRALSNWNATASPALITKYNNSGSSITATSYPDTWLGYYQRCGDNCYYIRLNSRTISAQASNFANYVTSTTVHEYGHAFNLAHNSLSASIMNHSRNRNVMTTPQPHDVADVNEYY
jgi:hypothetical protein